MNPVAVDERVDPGVRVAVAELGERVTFPGFVLATVVGVVGTLAATEALKILTNTGKPLVGRLWLWEADTATMRTLGVRRDPHCQVCSKRL